LITDSKIESIKETVFEGEEVSDGVAVRQGVAIDGQKDLSVATEEEINDYTKLIALALLITALETGDRKEVEAVMDWSLISYNLTRSVVRDTMVNSATESWIHRHYLLDSEFLFNQNAKALDTLISQIVNRRIITYNGQERKRLSVILRESKKQGWSLSKVASEIRIGSGLNSRQQKALFNLQNGMIEKGLTAAEIKKASNQYIKNAIDYRIQLTAQYEATTAVNEGHLQLWDQLVKDKQISSESEKEWQAILDKKTGVPDKALNGQRVKLSEKFIDPTLTHPPIARPPLRGNCRCDLELIPKGV